MSAVVHRGLADELRADRLVRRRGVHELRRLHGSLPARRSTLLPRRLFRYVELGLADRVREESETVFSCLLCRACEESCPAEVHITENVRVLRHWLLEAKR